MIRNAFPWYEMPSHWLFLLYFELVLQLMDTWDNGQPGLGAQVRLLDGCYPTMDVNNSYAFMTITATLQGGANKHQSQGHQGTDSVWYCRNSHPPPPEAHDSLHPTRSHHQKGCFPEASVPLHAPERKPQIWKGLWAKIDFDPGTLGKEKTSTHPTLCFSTAEVGSKEMLPSLPSNLGFWTYFSSESFAARTPL